MQFFLQYWYLRSIPWAWERYRHNVAQLEGVIAVKATARNLGQPLFQDFTFAGRLIGFFLRIIRIGIGLLLYFLIAIAHAVIFLFWLCLPVLAVIALLAFFFGHDPRHAVPTSDLLLP